MDTKSPSADGALDTRQGGEPVAQPVELLVDLGVGDLSVVEP
jgi:hypothetical protein